MPVPWPIPFADASGLEEWPKRDGVSRSIAKYRSPYAIFPCVPCGLCGVATVAVSPVPA